MVKVNQLASNRKIVPVLAANLNVWSRLFLHCSQIVGTHLYEHTLRGKPPPGV